MEWLARLRKEKDLYAGLIEFINKLDSATIQGYDSAKDFNEFLVAKGRRSMILELKLRLTREE